ncbi:TIGR03013 family XrtA/PEP-CTERM system glycosyltransferase [Dechloromonas denitrificans]|uniref:TIGR03013 family XrtA/PEP-CTERM system glycosyltransferase n=1 Tax=Azonexaceae TaxID=2008795 RepID=UPI001CF81B32|nr:TIGR03013 family XrtA/PEP-CTERM system glycosyltransferase [Dechloromonas denitrificans]UCV05542.1 TIGR03013 family PEP-CTERM/XrtA system glycosyltransferase [Dechloromonas denitrificans]UCV09889.1 TIGR03013 family PEP-CTERM/XrtA system glycosyltransferase [Dechloromonas denitrificans]
MIRLFNHWLRWHSIGQMLFDFSFVIVGLVIAVMWVGNGLPVNIKQVLIFGLLLGVAMLVINSWLGFYQRYNNRTIMESRARAVLSLYLAVPIAYGIFALLPLTGVSHEFLQLSAMSAVFGMLVTRVSAAHAPTTGMPTRKIMVFGTGARALGVKRALNKSDPSAEIVGFFPSPNEEQTAVPGAMLISRDRSLTDTAISLKVDEIVVALTERRGGSMPLRELLDCKLQGIRVLDLASHFEQTLGQIRLESLYAGWLIFGEGFRQGTMRTVVKRLFDIVCASILILLSLPIMAVTAIAIVAENGFPIFYRQERVGLNGRLFNVIKFRSMRNDAEKDGKPVWATAQDDRATKVGKIIRKLRIDELPQLFSVLKGDMSLVGPRPERPFFVDQLTKEIPFYAVRHSVKPGVTGWAQVRYHYGATVEDSAEKLQYDLYYVKNHSLFLDILVLFDTVGVVLTGKGAH